MIKAIKEYLFYKTFNVLFRLFNTKIVTKPGEKFFNDLDMYVEYVGIERKWWESDKMIRKRINKLIDSYRA